MFSTSYEYTGEYSEVSGGCVRAAPAKPYLANTEAYLFFEFPWWIVQLREPTQPSHVESIPDHLQRPIPHAGLFGRVRLH